MREGASCAPSRCPCHPLDGFCPGDGPEASHHRPAHFASTCFCTASGLARMLPLPWPAMKNTTPQPTAPDTTQDVSPASIAAGQHVRGRLLGVIAVTSIALLVILSATLSSGGLLGGRAFSVVTAMLVL